MRTIFQILAVTLMLFLGNIGEGYSQIDVRNRVEGKSSSGDLNTIKSTIKKKRKISKADLEKVASMKVNARYRKKRVSASKKCKKKSIKKTCGK